jgi:hypothetical protein
MRFLSLALSEPIPFEITPVQNSSYRVASLAESVGGFWLRQASQVVIQGDFHRFVRAKAIGSSSNLARFGWEHVVPSKYSRPVRVEAASDTPERASSNIKLFAARRMGKSPFHPQLYYHRTRLLSTFLGRTLGVLAEQRCAGRPRHLMRSAGSVADHRSGEQSPGRWRASALCLKQRRERSQWRLEKLRANLFFEARG